jgi:hypothetical protein
MYLKESKKESGERVSGSVMHADLSNAPGTKTRGRARPVPFVSKHGASDPPLRKDGGLKTTFSLCFQSSSPAISALYMGAVGFRPGVGRRRLSSSIL